MSDFIATLPFLIVNSTDRWRYTVSNCNTAGRNLKVKPGSNLISNLNLTSKHNPCFLLFQQLNRINVKSSGNFVHFHTLVWDF